MSTNQGETGQPSGLGPEPGWKHIDLPRSWGEGRSFVSGETDGDRIQIWYYTDAREPGVLFAKVSFGPGAEGPPGCAHGGSMAAVLDETMGFSAWVFGHKVLAATITVNFHKRLPLERVLIARAEVTRVENSRVTTTGVIYDPASDTRYASAEGLFIEQAPESFGGIAGAMVDRASRQDP